MDDNRFEVGKAFCGVTMQPEAQCTHCLKLRQQPAGPPQTVVAVDHDAGVVTIESEPEPELSTAESRRLDRLLASPLVKHLSAQKIEELRRLPRAARRVELAKLRTLAKKGARWVANRKGR
jgi:hypothetical protein